MAASLEISSAAALGQRRSASPGWSQRPCQRALDLAIALPLIVVLAPTLGLIALLVWLHDGAMPFYGQTRIGCGGRNFRCWKFRSMVTDADAVLRRLLAVSPEAREEWGRDHKLKADPRVTRIGRVLRATSLDELPQLWNVLCGEMSLVGPRPIVSAEVSRYGPRFSFYCTCRPGITGLWQISGRNDVSYRRRVAMDSLYARRRSTPLDVKILVLTVPAVLLRRGSY
nr:sugar transferase [Caulobacter sp. S45]